MNVYRGFDQESLDHQYRPSDMVADRDYYLQRYAELSAAARSRLDCEPDLRYGDDPDETLDLFPARAAGAPLQVYIHGGFWKLLSSKESSFAAPAFVEAGTAFAALNYSLAPKVRLDDIVRQCRSAIAWLHRNADRYGYDGHRIHVSGSSAGGHLVAMMMNADRERLHGVAPRVLRGGCAVSGVFDLEPVRLSYVNDVVAMDEAEARRNSPLLHLPPAAGPLIVAWGSIESDEFKRQSREFAAAWRAAGLACTDFEVPERNHFDVVLDLADPASRLCRAVLDQMGLAGA